MRHHPERTKPEIVLTEKYLSNLAAFTRPMETVQDAVQTLWHILYAIGHIVKDDIGTTLLDKDI